MQIERRAVLLTAALYKRLAFSNIPALLIVADVKSNRLYCAWLTSLDGEHRDAKQSITIPVAKIDQAGRDDLRMQFVEPYLAAA